MTEKYTPPTDDELMRVYREANEAAMHEANLRDGFGSNMSRESILAGLRAVAELGVPSAAHDAQVLRDAAHRMIVPDPEEVPDDFLRGSDHGADMAMAWLLAEADRIAGENR